MACEKRVLTPLEAAKELRVCRKTIYEMLRRGELPHIKAGDKYLIPVAAFNRYLENAGLKN